MKAKTFTVPFSKIVGEEATELEFGPEDYLVIRPIFSMSAEVLRAWIGRISQIGEDAADSDGDQLVLDLLNETILEWHLEGPEGLISQPKTAEALLKLPGAVAGSLFVFLSSYRGEGTNPTRGS